MKKSVKKVFAILACIACAVSMLAACGDNAATTKPEEKTKYTMTVRAHGTNFTGIEEDPLYKEWCDKFGVELEITELPSETMGEKTRLMVAAGNITDVMQAAFDFDEYLGYANQDLIGALPKDLEKKYPNIYRAIKDSGIYDTLNKTNSGEIYAMPRNLKIFSQERDAAAVNIDGYGFLFRMDWANKLGIEIPTIMEYDKFMETVKTIQNADFHGDNEIFGISVSQDEAPNLFMVSAISPYRNFFLKDGKYVFGLDQPEALEGVKRYKKAYEDGVLHPNYYAHKNQDALDRFFAGKAVCYYGNVGNESIYVSRKTTFKKSFPDLDPDKDLKLVWVKSPDGKLRGWENNNHWTTWYLSPKMTGERADKLLKLFDYAKSADGFKRFNLGVEGIDYTVEDGEYKLITWIDNGDGSYKKGENSKYKFANVLSMMSSEEHDDSPFLIYSDDTRNDVREFKEAKLKEDTDLNMINYDVLYFKGDKMKNFKSNFNENTLLTDLVVSTGDLEAKWEQKINGLRGILDPALKEINAALLGDK